MIRRIAILAIAIAAAGPAIAADAAHPEVVELFQSQGCSSCPPANANVMALADRPDILTLSFQVDYWDQLGWKDTFASPRFTARQWDYARALRHDTVWTPQVVINGRLDVTGIRRADLGRALAAGDRGLTGPRISAGAGQLRIEGAGPAKASTVWLVLYDPRRLEVPIARGENGGRTLPHRNIVRALVRLGDWSGGLASWSLPPTHGLRAAALVQSGPGGPILAAARL